MATKSFLKTVDIKDKRLAKDFIFALENAQNKSKENVVISKPVRKLSLEQIESVFSSHSK